MRECEAAISESAYFEAVMNGDADRLLREQRAAAAPKTPVNLSMPKSKKAMKHEARLEAEKNGDGNGTLLGETDTFKKLMEQLK